MSACTVVGIGGSVVTRSREMVESLARRVTEKPGSTGPIRVSTLGAASYARVETRPEGDPLPPDEALASLENPSSYDVAAFMRAISAARDDGRCDLLLLDLGPLCSIDGIASQCGLRIFIDIEARLMLLRWADALMDAGSPGGVEALTLYSSSVETVYASWSPAAIASSTLVLDEEEGSDRLVEKMLWLVEKSGPLAAGSRPAVAQGSATDAVKGGAERLSLIRAMEARYSRPASQTKGIGPAFRMFMADSVYPAMKRVLDVTLVSLLLMVIWPVFALVAFLIWLDDPGPVFYSQTRIGKFGAPFPFPKFRSMVRDADKLKDKLLAKNEMSGGITFKMKRDPRIIPIGFVIRKYSLDELPQLWSILKGDLSLVGPRPPVPREVALYTAADRRRLEAVPGLTCIWQVSGRSEIPFPKQVELDVEYLESRSLSLDLRLLLATIPAVLTGRGAY